MFIAFTSSSREAVKSPAMLSGLDPRRWSVARQLLALQVAVIALVTLGRRVRHCMRRGRRTRTQRHSGPCPSPRPWPAAPIVDSAVTSEDPTAILQPFAEEVRRRTDTDFVVIMSTEGIRWTHPNPAEIGGAFVGHIDQAVRGAAFTETYTGTLGPSVRAVVPVLVPAGASMHWCRSASRRRRSVRPCADRCR